MNSISIRGDALIEKSGRGVACVPAGFSEMGLCAVTAAIRADIAACEYDGAVVVVSRGGQAPWTFATGSSDASGTSLHEDAVFNLYSISKAFTNVLVYRCLDRGELTLSTPVAEIIPEFGGHKRELISIQHLLTHTSGLLPVLAPRAGMAVDRLDGVIAAICEHTRPLRSPGAAVWYSPMVAHALLGEVVRRCDASKRSFRQIAQDDLFEPLSMRDTAFGVRADLRERHVKPAFAASSPPMEYRAHDSPDRYGALHSETAEMPWLGAVSTARDLSRFAGMLRAGGELDGQRIVSAETLEEARRPQTGDLPHEIYRAHCLKRGWTLWPANFGLGFHLRGTVPGHYYHAGSHAPPETFFQVGIGSSTLWIDPVRDVTCVCLTTPVLGEAESIERFERLSDLVHAAVV